MITGMMALLFAGCFTTRPVEPPGSGNSEWVSPSDYQILLKNLENSLSQRNTQNYLRCFNPDFFKFSPAASVSTSSAAIFNSWNTLDEQAYLDNLFSSLVVTSGNSLTLTQTDLQDVSSDSLRYVGNYLLRMNHNDTTLTTLFKGQVQFLIKLNSFNEWEIHKWTDVETFQDSSWSALKLRFVQ